MRNCCSFTEAIVEGLAQGKADKNADQIITTQELADFIAKRVLQLNEKANHNLQYPQFKNKLPTDLPLFEIGF
jgi:DNA-directed RNA polymerase subunit K/omega